MVEMTETAHTKNYQQNSSNGRNRPGASTYDGVALAWACANYMRKSKNHTLFATHYFELTELPQYVAAARNLHRRESTEK